MTNQEIIEQLKSLKCHCEDFRDNEDCVWSKDVESLNGAIEALEKQATIQATSKWILCSERLPDDLVAVNVTWINRCPQNYYMHIKDKPFTDTAVLYRGEWYWWDTTIIDYLSEYGAYVFETVDKSTDILAWMALPEPWKGESE